MTPQELGPYLLLRKLSESALCETYRAGQRSGQEVERVVLLYFFNSDPDDAQWLSETAQAGRRALSGLESPSLSAAIDSGEIAGAAYLAYDYIPGRSLEVVLEKARALESAIPIEHALLITDRIAQGLQAAWDHESRALHGFVVPHLVMMSNEGDVQLLGLEVASRLRKLLANEPVREQMGRYLAPEVVPEGQPSTTDDVFSLGALLFEMVTGHELPEDTDRIGDAITEARTLDGESLPTPIGDLLRSSLTTSFGRSDLKTWRAQLSTLLTSGEFDADAFNLALFLHTLFGDEIESEADEALGEGALLGTEKAEDVVSPIEALADEVDEATPPDDSGAVPEALTELPAALIEEAPGSGQGRTRLLAMAAGVVFVLAVGFAAFKFFGPSEDAGDVALQSSETAPLTAAAPTQPAGGTLPNPEVDSEPATEQVEAPSPEEIDRRVQELLSQRSADMETSMRREFESELAELRQQLVEAQERATAAEELQTATEEPVDPLSDEDAETLRMASTTSFEDADTAAAFPAVPSTEAEAFGDEGLADGNPEDAVDTAPSIEERTGVETTDLLDSQPEAAEAAQSSPEPLQTFSAPVREPVAEVTKPEPEPEPAAVEPVEESVPPTTVDPTPEVQVGDLVAPGPGVTAPRITSPARPVYPILARRLKKSAVVTVKVLVDETGRVTEAERLGDEAGYGFDNAAVEAALATRFEPATKGGVPVKIWWTVRIAFQP